MLLASRSPPARARGTLIDGRARRRLADALIEMPARVNEVLNHGRAAIRRIAEDIVAEARDVLYLGRGTSFPIALEGALKLKEISYIHAEGYAAGEMKHGPIALIDEAVPVIVVAPPDDLFEKTASNFEQVMARGGKRGADLSDAAGVARLGPPCRGGDRGADGRSVRGADPLRDPGAAAGLLHVAVRRAPTSTSRATSRRA